MNRPVVSVLDSKLHPDVWDVVQREFGGSSSHTCDLMALDSNVMCDLRGNPLPHFSPYPSPASCGVNLFAQGLNGESAFLDCPYLFPPFPLVGPVISFISSQKKNCTLVSDYLPKEVLVASDQKVFVQICKIGGED